MLFAHAEHLHMTVGKLLTGKDMPISSMEMALQNTYRLAQRRFEKQQGKKR